MATRIRFPRFAAAWVILIVSCVVCGLILWLSLCGKPSHRKSTAERNAEDILKPECQQILDQIKAVIAETAGVDSDKIVGAVQRFIFQNSDHEIDAEHEEYAWSPPKVLSKLLARSKGGNAPPHLSCGPRAIAMKAILDHFKIQSRITHVFSDDFDNIRSHTVVEVFNLSTLSWEARDPDNDVRFLRGGTSQALSVMDMVRDSLHMVEPMSSLGVRGWEENNLLKYRDHYFEALMYELPTGKDVPNEVLVNMSKMSPQHVFPGNEGITFSEFVKKEYSRVVLPLTDVQLGK